MSDASSTNAAGVAVTPAHPTKGLPRPMQSWPAPAKLNLFLHIIGRRPDGYHLLQTAFQFLDYGDELVFKLRDDGKITRTSNYDGIKLKHDMVIRAASLLQQRTGQSLGVDIQVYKRLPMGAGLGGGSSNAATTLVALNALWEDGLSVVELAELGLALGADVPVFIHGHAAWAEGVGEQLTPIKPVEQWFLVIHPGINVSTAEIFNATDLTRKTPAITIRDFLRDGGRNDCEAVVRKAHPAVAELLDWLGKKAQAKMTGTGACVFAAFSTDSEARQILQELPQQWQGCVCRSRNTSPLLERLSRV